MSRSRATRLPVVLDEGEAQNCSFVLKSRVKVVAAEAASWLGDCRLQSAQFPNTCCPTRLLNDFVVEFQ